MATKGEKAKNTKKPVNKSDKKNPNEDLSRRLFELCTKIQKDSLKTGKELNDIMVLLNPKAEKACVGVGSRAAGILVFLPDGRVLLGVREEKIHGTENQREKRLIIPGGKAQDDEDPLRNAVREFGEEFLVKINEDIVNNPQLSYYIVDGKYTIFLIPAASMFPEPDKVISEYKSIITSTLLVTRENPKELRWVNMYKGNEDVPFHDFTMVIRDSIGVKNFLSKLGK